MDTFADIIKAFGGPSKFAVAIGISDTHAHTINQRDSIPPAYWSDTVEAANERDIAGVTFKKLAEIAKAKRKQTESA